VASWREVRTRGKTYAILAIVAVSTPLMLAVETWLRQRLLPPEFEEVRAWLREDLTPMAWGTVLLVPFATFIGLRLHRWYVARELARLPPDRRTEENSARVRFDALMLSTSAPQLPALAATVLFMFGAALGPVLVSLGMATLGVLVLGAKILRSSPNAA
jgi:hypothetical protein